jgi:ABC-2 type transport system permease protein
VAEEKENRTIELVLTSVQPWQVMAGKVLGLGALSLLQLLVWLVFGRGLLSVGAPADGLGGSGLSADVWLWMIVLFLLGFLLFGSIMAAVGAIGASVRESGQITGFLTLPLLLPLWFAPLIAQQPNSTLSLVLSLLPITAPVTMILRLSEGAVPAWQLALSLTLLVLAVVGAMALAARLFRATTLLTGAKPTPRVIWRALRGT